VRTPLGRCAGCPAPLWPAPASPRPSWRPTPPGHRPLQTRARPQRYHEAYAPLVTYLEAAGPGAADAIEVRDVIARIEAAFAAQQPPPPPPPPREDN
jgi:hypothetical protein